MGGVLSALAALGPAIGSLLASAAEAAGLIASTWTISVPAIYSGLYSTGIALTAAAGGLAPAAFTVGASTISLVQTGWVLTTFGTAVLAGIGVTAAVGTLIGVTIALSGASGPPTREITLLDKLNSQKTLLCTIDPKSDGCRAKLHTNGGKRTVRIQRRKTKQPTVLSYATPVRVSRKRHNVSHKDGPSSKSRKISTKNKRLRSKSRK